ncbi:hypothetical protein NDU88_006190 [Pleurodeles waltl]|uniref:Uncharacterized protein n=1 Tax=Pleurodeles waltl TaxID=8319 RepID=A0AAV7VP56_PLEWA|nr:hypothetical protein NDU88_006190 [Pleurodeles waltl]
MAEKGNPRCLGRGERRGTSGRSRLRGKHRRNGDGVRNAVIGAGGEGGFPRTPEPESRTSVESPDTTADQEAFCVISSHASGEAWASQVRHS